MGTERGLRESKKQETRRLISDHATRLFIEQGFEATTIAEIAAAARVAKKTVTNYFPRKEDLALDHHEAFTQSLARVVAGLAPGEPPLPALGRAFRATLVGHSPVAGFTGPEFARMVADSPTLTARLRELHDRREEALAEALAAASPGTVPSIAPRATAALIAAADRLLFRRIQELTLAGRTNDEIEAELTPEADHVYGLLLAAVGPGAGGGPAAP
ncbi:TetR/AcrR family transcriptional regulator [Streptomyces caatingaensis]|uniref:TetR family transcriptional regulator n=1 Tax=Streptomyces caatingaensis TaxID=1678637 RepID=A0A0K9XMU6_9ACTN|nr:TetR family transcriptional regulator [Streptomyces caatingaensis]KNB54017.1 TetR family transcriptional regulator [Streptomyces caatingaensis]